MIPKPQIEYFDVIYPGELKEQITNVNITVFIQNISIWRFYVYYKRQKFIQIFGSFWGYWLNRHEWWSYAGLLDFQTPQKNGVWTDKRQHNVRW